jgi:hypothetical protein
MDLSHCLAHCRICSLRKMDVQTGLLCSLTQAKPNFTDICPSFSADEAQVSYYRQREQQLASDMEEASGFFAAEQKGVKKGVMGGMLMIVIALVWFIGGLALDRIFFYPPVLLLFGIYAVVKGLYFGNFNGERS